MHTTSYEDEERDALVGVGYSLDPEEHPGERLVAEPWLAPVERGYEVELSFDPDALMFGAPRVWKLEIVTKDPRYPVGRRYEQEIASYEEDLRGETTASAVAMCMRFLGIMRRRHRLVARSEDGDREIWIEEGCDAVVKKKEPLHPVVASEDDGGAESAYADFSSTEGARR